MNTVAQGMTNDLKLTVFSAGSVILSITFLPVEHEVFSCFQKRHYIEKLSGCKKCSVKSGRAGYLPVAM
jgi:hypothetical protein